MSREAAPEDQIQGNDLSAAMAMFAALQGQQKSKVGDTFRKMVTAEGRSYWITAKFIDENGHFTIEGDPQPVFPPPAGTDPAVVKAQAEADKAVLDLSLAQWAYDNDIPVLKAKYDLEETAAKITELRIKNAYLPDTIESSLATAAQSIAESKARTAKTVAETDISVAKAPGEIAETGARTGLLRSQATQTEIENAIKVLGPLATIEEREAALEEMVRRRVISPETAAQIGARFDKEIATGIPALESFKEEQATARQTATNQAAMDRQVAQDEAAARRATQTAQTTAATSITGDEAARQRQILQSTVSQQANQAQATNAFINNYQNTASPSPIASGAGFLDGLAMVKDIFTSIKDIAQPSPQVPQAQGFIGSLLANQGGGVPPGPGVAPPPGVAAPPPQQEEYFDDPLMAAAAADDDTPLPDEDLAQIMPLMQTDPKRAANLSVEAWQRMVSGKSRVGAR